jgi:predicted negative regulator of RcsB-dependent stress response
MSKYNRKQKKPAQDEFVDFWTKLFQKLQPYAKAILITIGSAVAMWFIIYGLTGWREHKREAAAEQFGKAVRIYDAELLSDDAKPPQGEEETPRFKTASERANATFAALDELNKNWSGSDVARDSLVFRAGVDYDLGKLDEAAANYRKFLEELKGADVPLASLAREGLGLTLEAQGKLDEALTVYQALEPKQGDFYRDRALYAQARVYQRKGDKEKAKSLYQQILIKTPQTLLKDEIQTRLAILEAP